MKIICSKCKKEFINEDCEIGDLCSECSTSNKAELIGYNFPTEDTVPIMKLHNLRCSEEVNEIIKDPYIQQIILTSLSDKNPTKAIDKAMKNPEFMKLANACLKVVEPQNDDVN